MVTIKMIAEHAKVSIATVSRVLNQDETMSVHPETRKNIFRIADELGYTKYKKNLQTKKRLKKVAILQWYTQTEEINDLYYYAIRIGIERRAQELGYEIIRIFHDNPLSDAQVADGVIAIGKYSKEQIRSLEAINEHLVFVDSDTLNAGHSCVTTDFSNATRNVIDHFLSQNQTQIGMLIGKEWTEDKKEVISDPRFYTFKNYLSEKQLFNSRYVFVGEFTTESGYQLMKTALIDCADSFPQAFFVASDAMAIGALRALQEKGISVPNSVSLISFNDTAIAKQVYPPLSCVTVYTEEMGITAMNTLDQQIHSFAPQVPFMSQLSTTLTLRGTSLNN